MDPFNALPDEVLLAILSTVDARTLGAAVPLVCKRFERVSSDPVLWKSLCVNACGSWIVGMKGADASWKRALFANCCTHFASLCILSARDTVAMQLRPGRLLACDACPPLTAPRQRLWICLDEGCRQMACWNLYAKHAQEHHRREPTHALMIEAMTKTVWCIPCKRWIGLRSGPEQDKHDALQAMLGA